MSITNDDVKVYGDTSGWSGSATSEDRARTEDEAGITADRWKQAVQILDYWGRDGVTWRELARETKMHHGQASAVLSGLHKAGHVARLTETRERCRVYVLVQYVNGRETEEHGARMKGRRQKVADIAARLREIAAEADLDLQQQINAAADELSALR